MSVLKIGVIGCGSLARATHLPHLHVFEAAELAWACDTSDEALGEVRDRFRPARTTKRYTDVIDDPEVEAIVLATNQRLRLPVIRAAAEAGKGIYCEKPMAATLAEMEEIREVVDAAGVVFCVGHNRRSAPAMVYAREAFTRARRTRPSACWRLDRNSGSREPWPEERQMNMLVRINDDLLSWKPWALEPDISAKGPMLFEMTHFTDLVCWFFERKPVSVTAVGQPRVNQSVSVLFDDGSLATILMTGVGTFSYPKELYELYANGSAVVVDHLLEVRTGDVPGFPARRTFPFKRDTHTEIRDGGGIRDWHVKRRAAEETAVQEDAGAEHVLANEGTPDKGHERHLAAFLDAVQDAGPSPCPAADAIRATRIAFAAIESLARGRSVDL